MKKNFIWLLFSTIYLLLLSLLAIIGAGEILHWILHIPRWIGAFAWVSFQILLIIILISIDQKNE